MALQLGGEGLQVVNALGAIPVVLYAIRSSTQHRSRHILSGGRRRTAGKHGIDGIANGLRG